MAKLTLIALAAAALGIGGIALPSKHDNSNDDASYATASVAEVSAPAFAAPAILGPFERSAAACATGKYQCVTFGGATDPNRVVRVSDVIPRTNNWDEIKQYNGWSDSEISLDTVVSPGVTIAFGVKSS